MSKLLYFAMSGLIIVLAGTLGFAQSSGSFSVQWGDHPGPPPSPPPVPAPPPVIEVYPNHGGPPPHPHHRHVYYYYPYRNIYFEPHSGMYFYWAGNQWVSGPALPPHLAAHQLGTYVSIEMESEHPWKFNPDHVRMYPRESYRGRW